MQLLPSLLFGISASLDALIVGISYGLRKIQVRAWQNLFISLVALLGTCLSAYAGSHLLPLLPAPLTDYVGSIVLILLGVYYITKWGFSYLSNRQSQNRELSESKPAAAQKPPVNPPVISLSVRETLVLSMVLSVNNIGIGLSASMAGLPMTSAAAMTFFCSAVLLVSGNRLGQSPFLRRIGTAADPISGFLLIGLGIMQLFL